METKFKWFNVIASFLILILLFFVSIIWADSNGVWVNAEDIRAGIFGVDEEEGNYTFQNNLIVKKELCIEEECYDSWDSICESWLASKSVN